MLTRLDPSDHNNYTGAQSQSSSGLQSPNVSEETQVRTRVSTGLLQYGSGEMGTEGGVW